MHLKPDSRPEDRPVPGTPGNVSLSDLFHLIAAGAFDAELRLIAEQAQMLTLASGAAIALRQDELLVCRARAGNMAPALGARLDIQSGLSGECVRSACTLVCADTEKDARVNLDVCRYLGIRSMAVLPISLSREVVGVFEVFSPQPGAFTGNEVAALESMRDLVISVIRPGPQAESAAAAALGERAAEEEPAAAVLRPAAIPDPEDDLICEIEQRAPVKPESIPQARAFQLIKAESQQVPAATPRIPPPFANPDPEDDLICEIEMRSARPAAPAAPQPHPAHAMRGFAPAPPTLPEHTISRKLILAGVVVALAGLIWLRWCNRAPHAAGNTVTSSTVEAASRTAPPLTAPPAATAPSSSPPAAQPPPATSQAPPEPPTSGEESSSEPPPPPRPEQATPSQQALRAKISRREAKAAETRVPHKAKRAAMEKALPLNSAAAAPASLTGSAAQPGSMEATSVQAAPAARPTPVVRQQAEAAPPKDAAEPPVQLTPPPFQLRPAPAPAAPSPGGERLSLNQAVVKAVPQSSGGKTLSHDALNLLLESAKAGDAGAQLALGVRYATGEGVAQSYPEALKWFTQASAQGVTPTLPQAAQAWSKVQQWAQSQHVKK
ncbi:MAG TPA: GAF domain-containing protein [Terriglobales bacterium]|nr:GAF domain-containing protein [Terriglobales bacterium]